MPLPFLLLVLAAASSDTLRSPFAGGQPWHQEVAYEITASLDEPSGVLAGTQKVRYVNRSPDTLSTFSLHLHLNAFRPGSRWSETDARERRNRFQDLRDPDFAFNHVRNVTIDGTPVIAEYPFAPDSTIVRFTLPAPLAPDAELNIRMEWDARPSTLPRRQGRRGRAFDFAQWYPKVVVYDRFGWNEQPLVPAGEFYGEFATYDVTLNVAEDQVVGATGVPLCGDPGWARVNATSDPINYGRDAYDAPGRTLSDVACPAASPGRKTIRWRAEQVHHFAMSLNPAYRYEGGVGIKGTLVHVLYQPGDEKTWGGGVAVNRTKVALAWLDDLFGEYQWPQLTNVHRIEGGGTEFPMMVHDGSADQGLIVHEVGHNYVMGHLANNEWREGWLDEGFTSFQTSWFWETVGGRGSSYAGLESAMLGLDLDRMSQPTSLKSDQYRDFATYSTMIYARGELFFHQLRNIVGDDVMKRILRTYFERFKLRHVDEAAFRGVAEEVSGRDLGAFFATFLHTNALVNYRIGKVERQRRGQGWVSRIEVRRTESGYFPVEVLVVGGDGDSTRVRAEGFAEREFVEVTSASKPREIVLDPENRSHDWNALDNYRRYFFRFDDLLGAPRLRKNVFFDTHVSTPQYRDRIALGVLPTAWYNDRGGLTLGLRTRESYLGRFEQNQFLITSSTGAFKPTGDTGPDDVDIFVRLRNPLPLRLPNLSQTFEGFSVEGRYGARIDVTKERRDHLGFGPVRRQSIGLRWMKVRDAEYLQAGTHDDLGFVELYSSQGVRDLRNGWTLDGQVAQTFGFAYDRPATGLGGSSVAQGYLRLEGTGTAKRALSRRSTFAARLYVGASDGLRNGTAPVQRLLNVNGADAVDRFYHPFLRSEGALLARNDVFYHLPGGANMRGFSSALVTQGIAALNLEADQALLVKPRAKLLQRVAIAGFADVAHAFGDKTGNELGFLADAGVGVRALWRVGQSAVTTRFDLPLFVSRPLLAQDTGPGADRGGFRWTFSFAPAL